MFDVVHGQHCGNTGRQLYFVHQSVSVHATGHVDRVTPNIVLRLDGTNNYNGNENVLGQAMDESFPTSSYDGSHGNAHSQLQALGMIIILAALHDLM